MKDPKRMYNKNEAKSLMKRYLIIMICFLPILILLNFTVFSNLASGWIIFLDVILALGFTFVISAIWNSIAQKKQEKKDALIRQMQLQEKLEKKNSKNNCNKK